MFDWGLKDPQGLAMIFRFIFFPLKKKKKKKSQHLKKKKG